LGEHAATPTFDSGTVPDVDHNRFSKTADGLNPLGGFAQPLLFEVA
jgi:hypothetical protein